MTTNQPPTAITRTFQDIPDNTMNESDQISFLFDLGWSKGLTWDGLLEAKRILIISEAGAGKTYECRTKQQELWNIGAPAFFVELADLAGTNLRELMSHDESVRFDEWLLSQSDVATFFLDSVDELKLSLGSLEQALKRMSQAIEGHLNRVRVVITSRPIPIDEQLFRKILPVPEAVDETPTSQQFAEVAMRRSKAKASAEQSAKDWRNVALLPLSNAQIKEMAISEGVDDPDALLSDINQRNAADFVRRPQDLIELCADWREHRRIRSHREQVASNITVKLKPRTDRRERAELSATKAFEGACRIALAATLCRKLTIRHSAEADREGGGSEHPLDPSTILPDWNQDERTTLLERSLFGFASYGRVRFHHRSVIEFLASEQLQMLRLRGMTTRSIFRILFTSTAQGRSVVRPSLRPAAAWLAASDAAVLDQALKFEPDILINHGDPESLSPAQRQQALRAYVDRHASGGWRGLRVPAIQVHRFASPELSKEVMRLWENGVENTEVREILINLIGLGKMHDCADIVFGVVTDAEADHRERIDALIALIQLGDGRLEALAQDIPDDAKLWPNRLARAAISELFPSHMSVEVLCKSLARVTEKKGTVGDISWRLPRLIESADLSSATLDELRQGLTELAVEGIAWEDKKWPHLASKRQFLLASLAATCLRQIEAGTTTREVMRSSVIATRLGEREYDRTEPAKKLENALATAAMDVRQTAFEEEDALLQYYHPQPDPMKRYAQLAFHETPMHLTKKDNDWIIASLGDRRRPKDYRAVMLEAAIRLRNGNVTWEDHLMALRSHVADLPALVERLIDLAKPRKQDASERKWQRESAKRKKQEERRDAKAHASWLMFWRELSEHPDKAFSPDRSENTAWHLWQAMERSGDESRASGWNRRFIEQYFSKDVADRLRIAVMAYWRNDRPTLRSERPSDQKRIYLIGWQLGLAGIAAEAEDPHWAKKLTVDDANLALRYVPIELSGFPAWLEEFAAVHPTVVDVILGDELASELSEPAGGHSGMLQNIRYSTPSVARLFIPRLRQWLDDGKWRVGHNEDEMARTGRVRQIAEILIEHGDEDTIAHVVNLAKSELSDGATDLLKSIWLPLLMNLEPVDGVDALEKTLEPYAPSQKGVPSNWFSSLFGDRNGEGATSLSSSRFAPELLLRLARIAYRYIIPTDDIVREEGSYTPVTRDDAERGRANIINALLSTPGPEGWEIKMKLAADPLFADFRDRALAMALEKAAEEADDTAFHERDVVALNQLNELPPLTRDEIFTLMADRISDLQDMLLRDDSPRAAWALINDEKIMRQTLARELNNASNGAYTVDQEAVTADEKETDIRLRSKGSEHEAVIELKVGDKPRSAADLRSTIKEQLVAKYMAAENCRAGCLLVTVNGARTWQHPDTGDSLDFSELIEMLNADALKLEEDMGKSLRLGVYVLNLRPRLLPESATNKRKSKSLE